MSLNNYIYMFCGKGMNPKHSKAEINSDSFSFTALGANHLDQEIEVPVGNACYLLTDLTLTEFTIR